MKLREAREIIGSHAPGDYVLDPAAHRDVYKDRVPALSQILERSAVSAYATAYAQKDQDAIKAAKSFRTWMRIANLGAFFTSVFSAGGMAFFLIADDSNLFLTGSSVLSGLACAAAALGAAGLFFLRQGQLLETWMRRRAMAETHRIAYFNQVLTEAKEQPAPALLLALEYYRRYQFDVQKSFFQTRARQHDVSAKKTVAIGAVGAFFATVASFSGFTSGIEAANAHAMSAIAVFGAALGAFSIGREQMTQDRRNSERYERTYMSLLELTKTLDPVAEALTEGNVSAVSEFTSAVEEQISNEHRQWLEETEATNTSLARIQTALEGDKDDNTVKS